MKLTKVLSLVLALALLVIGAVALTASAEEAPSVEIVSKNLSYDSNISILFAVKTANTDVAPKLDVYTMVDGDLVFEKSVDATFTPSNSLEKVGFANAYIFFTDGIVAKHLDSEIYVQAVVGEYKSDMERYSVVEYCHEMNAQKATDKYNKIIEYGALVQQMLAEDGKFSGAYATDYKYVTIDGGTLDGQFDSGIYLKGETVTPYAEGGKSWMASDGTIVENGETYTVGEINVNIAAFREGVLTVENATITGTDAGNGNYTSVKQVDLGENQIFKTSTSRLSCVTDKVYGKDSKVLKLDPSTGVFDVQQTFKALAATSDDVVALELSSDIKFEKVSDNINLKIGVAGMLNNGSTYDFYAIKITSTDEGALLMTNLASSSGSESEAVTIGTVGNYINLKLLFVKGENDTMEKLEVYVNGTLAATYATAYGTFTNTYGKTFTEATAVHARIRDIDADNSNYIYMDNIYFGYTK